MDPILIGVIAIIAALVGVAIIAALRGRGGRAEFQALNKSWREVAIRTRLKFTPPERDIAEASLTGSFRQREVAVTLRLHAGIGSGGGRDIITYTQIQASVRNTLRHYLRFSRKGGYRKTDRFLGAPYEATGDKEIDRLFDMKGIPPGIPARALAAHPDFRKRLVEIKREGYVELEIEGPQIRFEQEGLIHDAAYLMALLEMIDACALAVEKAK